MAIEKKSFSEKIRPLMKEVITETEVLEDGKMVERRMRLNGIKTIDGEEHMAHYGRCTIITREKELREVAQKIEAFVDKHKRFIVSLREVE